MKFYSKNISESLKQLMVLGIIKPPYPNWLTEFSISGKNIIKIG